MIPTNERLAELRAQRDDLARDAAVEAAARAAMHTQRLEAARAAGQRDATLALTYAEIAVALAELDRIAGDYMYDPSRPTRFVQIDPARRAYLQGVADIAKML